MYMWHGEKVLKEMDVRYNEDKETKVGIPDWEVEEGFGPFQYNRIIIYELENYFELMFFDMKEPVDQCKKGFYKIKKSWFNTREKIEEIINYIIMNGVDNIDEYVDYKLRF